MNNNQTRQYWGRWYLATSEHMLIIKRPSSCALGVDLKNLLVDKDHRRRWLHEVIGTMPGITKQDIEDLERASEELTNAKYDLF